MISALNCSNSCTTFNNDFKYSRSNFFRSFNSIYGKISKANDAVIDSLVKYKCIPILMYGLEALDLNKTMLNKLDSPLYQAFSKIFKTFEKSILNSCMFYLDTLPLSYVYLLRKVTFLYKIKHVENCLLKCSSDSFGNAESNKLFLSLPLKGNSSVGDFRHNLWLKFQQSL